jgi:hypothetical protein
MNAVAIHALAAETRHTSGYATIMTRERASLVSRERPNERLRRHSRLPLTDHVTG